MAKLSGGDMELADDIVTLITHDDARGDFTELIREDWKGASRLRQWSLLRTRANVMRGTFAQLIAAYRSATA